MWSARRRLSTVVVQRFCKPKVGGSNPSAGTIPSRQKPRTSSRRTYPQYYALIRSRICAGSHHFPLDSQPFSAHIQSVVPIFGSKPWSPGNFGFRGFLVSGVLAGPWELRFRGFFVSWRCRISAPPIGRPNIFGNFRSAWNREARRVFCLRGSNLRMRTMEPRILRYPGLTCS